MPENELKLEIVTEHPLNAATHLSALSNARTTNPLTYVRNHFSIPVLDEKSWQLRIGGAVEHPREFSLAEVRGLGTRSQVISLECAGNGRTSMDPRPKGTPWGYGAVSVIELTGTTLSNLLETVGLQKSVVELSFHGADEGEVEPGRSVSYGRSLPLDVALHPDTMLVWAMNGETLTPEHGYPLRLHVPGWCGMAVVKWLSEIRALAEPFEGFFQNEHYVYRGEAGTAEAEPVHEMRVRSLITSPQEDETLPFGMIDIMGVAWSGNVEITQVEVSTDGGVKWEPAGLSSPESKFAPSVWTHPWTPEESGTYTLLSRATDSAGDIQPLEQRWNQGGYGNNGVQAVKVEIN
jgi:DMSO/TMAO reductase YedYZ molybdopterin-dependent catalytic subunit